MRNGGGATNDGRRGERRRLWAHEQGWGPRARGEGERGEAKTKFGSTDSLSGGRDTGTATRGELAGSHSAVWASELHSAEQGRNSTRLNDFDSILTS